MNETLSTINQGAQLVLTLCGIAATVIAALAGSRWGKSRAVQTAADVTAILQQVATVAVQATEQSWSKAPAPDGGAGALRKLKLGEATGRARALLPAGVDPGPLELESAIESAVKQMNAERPVVTQ